MPVINPFATFNQSIDMLTLTQAINKLPTNYSKLGDMGLFTERGVPTNTVMVEEKNGILTLLKSKNRGEPATVGKSGKRTTVTFDIPHFPLEDVVLPSDVQGKRLFGSESQLETVNQKVLDKLQAMKNAHELTKEWLRVGAIKGLVKDGDNSTSLYSLFTKFNVGTPKTASWALTTDTTKVMGLIQDLKGTIEDDRKGSDFTGIGIMCGTTFFKNLVNHPLVLSAWERWRDGEVLRSDHRAGFEIFPGVFIWEYRGTVTDSAGNSVSLLDAAHGYAYPIGGTGHFEMIYGPGDFNETANTFGLPFYASAEPRPHNRGVDLHTQTNPLAICNRPDLLCDITGT